MSRRKGHTGGGSTKLGKEETQECYCRDDTPSGRHVVYRGTREVARAEEDPWEGVGGLGAEELEKQKERERGCGGLGKWERGKR